MNSSNAVSKAAPQNLSELKTFLSTVFSYCEGHVAVRMLRETGTKEAPPKSRYLPLNDRLATNIAALVRPAADDMRGLYVVPCTILEPGNAKAENISQTCVIPCDLDRGDIAAKQSHLERLLGPASLVVLSGGSTDEGQPKRHLYWRLTEACGGGDLDKVIEIRSRIIAAVDADDAFKRLTQPIRVAGSIHGKYGYQNPVRLETFREREYDLGDLVEAAQNLPVLPGLVPKVATNRLRLEKVNFTNRQTRRVRAGGVDEENRFSAISGTIGHWIRQVRLGVVSLEEGRKAVDDYNLAMVEPPWPAERVAREFEALFVLDRKKNADAWRKLDLFEYPSSSSNTAPGHSEDAIALSFVATNGSDWRHVALWGKWLNWTGTHWQIDETREVQDRIRAVCRACTSDLKPGEARRIASARTIKAVESIASSDRQVALGTDALDTHCNLLNTPAGTVDLETGAISPAERAHHLTQITTASPGVVPSIWSEFLCRITGKDASLMAYLARICGYCLTGETSEQAFFFFHGEGGNGKSVFIQTIAKALGSYAATAPLDSFTVSRNSTHPTDLAGLRGKRLVTVTETEQGRAWAESRIKTITGGDPIRARLLYRDFFEFQPTFKLIVVGNHRPQLTSVGTAMRRRLQLVPFTITIPDDLRDKDLATKLESQIDGVLGWMLDGYREWQRLGLSPPESVIRASEAYFEDEDLVGQWIAEQCDLGAKRSALSKALYENWSAWADAHGVERGSTKSFGEALRSRSFVSRHVRSGTLWQGLSLRSHTGASGE